MIDYNTKRFFGVIALVTCRYQKDPAVIEKSRID